MANTSSSQSSTPRDVTVIQSILKDMGVTDYEPAVISQLMDFCYKYTTDILEDAKAFSNHANKKSIDIDDTKLAVQLKLDKSYTNPPPRELLLDIAAHKNSQSLALIKPYTGPKLPPDRYCLSAMNYQLKKSKKSVLSYSTAVPFQRQVTPKGSLLQPISLVGKQVVTTAANIRPIKTPVTSRPTIQAIVNHPTTSGVSTVQQQSQGLASALGIEQSRPVKRKLEPDDDYDI